MEDILIALQNVEEVAEDILKIKQEIIDLNVKLNKNREALNALKRSPEFSQDVNNEGERPILSSNKLWLCFGNSFVKTRVSSAKTLIEEDQKNLNKRINDLRNDLKPKVDHLRQLEGNTELKGFDLKPLDRQELAALNTLL